MSHIIRKSDIESPGTQGDRESVVRARRTWDVTSRPRTHVHKPMSLSSNERYMYTAELNTKMTPLRKATLASSDDLLPCKRVESAHPSSNLSSQADDRSSF